MVLANPLPGRLPRRLELRRGVKFMAQEVRDPVCGMMVDPEKAAGKSVYQGQTYYFCGIGCKKAFDADPERYVRGNDHVHHHNHPH